MAIRKSLTVGQVLNQTRAELQAHRAQAPDESPPPQLEHALEVLEALPRDQSIRYAIDQVDERCQLSSVGAWSTLTGATFITVGGIWALAKDVPEVGLPALAVALAFAAGSAICAGRNQASNADYNALTEAAQS